MIIQNSRRIPGLYSYCCHDVWTKSWYLCTANSPFGHWLTLLAGLTFSDQNWKWRFSLILMFGSSRVEKWKFWWGLFGRWQHFASCSIWPRPARRSSSSSTCRGWSSVSWTRSQTISAYQILPPGTAKKICAGTPRITRGMGTNITLEPGERVSLAFIAIKSFWPLVIASKRGVNWSRVVDKRRVCRSTKTYSFECPFPFINLIHWTLL